jgi:hypothetical protein
VVAAGVDESSASYVTAPCGCSGCGSRMDSNGSRGFEPKRAFSHFGHKSKTPCVSFTELSYLLSGQGPSVSKLNSNSRPQQLNRLCSLERDDCAINRS